MSDYEIHLGSDDFRNLLGDESNMDFAHGFGDDDAEIERIIQEEIGRPNRRKAKKRPR